MNKKRILISILISILLLVLSLVSCMTPTDAEGDKATYNYTITPGTWATGTLTATSDIIWYSFSGVSGTVYTVKWDDSYQGSGTYTADIKVSAYRANQSTSYFTNVDSGWTTPKTLTASATETIYIKVVPYSASSSYLGTFGLLVTGGSTPVATPTFSPAAGTYTAAQSVTISTTTSGASIRYTTDGSNPTSTTGTLYSSAITVSATTTIKAIAYKSGMTDSAVASATYTININPDIPLTLGTWKTGTLASTSDVLWYYFSGVSGSQYTIKWDDSYQGSGTYTGDLRVSAYRADKTTAYFTDVDSGYTTPQTITASATETIYVKVIPYSAQTQYLGTFGLLASGVLTPVATPTFSPAGGTYASAQSVTISTTTSGASIRYTTDGSNPTSTTGTLYSSAITVSTTTTIKAIAYKADMADSTIASATYTIGSAPTGEWLIMMYMGGDTNLEAAMWGDVNEVEVGLYNLSSSVRAKTKVIVLWDGATGSSSSGGYTSACPSGTVLYEMGTESSQNTSISANTINKSSSATWLSSGEVNMADGTVLTNFLSWCNTNYPGYTNHMLILSDHGGGQRNGGRAAIWDDGAGGFTNVIYTMELQQAIANAGYSSSNKLAILGFDACLMAGVEEAYQHRNVAKYLVASLESEQGDGWEYNHWIPQITLGMTPAQLGTILVQSYRTNFDSVGDQTLSCTDLTQLAALKTAIDALAAAIVSTSNTSAAKTKFEASTTFDGTYTKLIEMGAFAANVRSLTGLSTYADAVISAMANAIVYSWADSSSGNYYGDGSTTKKGLHICGKTSGNDGSTAGIFPSWYSTTNLDFATTGSTGVDTWKELLDTWY